MWDIFLWKVGVVVLVVVLLFDVSMGVVMSVSSVIRRVKCWVFIEVFVRFCGFEVDGVCFGVLG